MKKYVAKKSMTNEGVSEFENLRQQRALTKSQFARELGISAKALAGLERGNSVRQDRVSQLIDSVNRILGTDKGNEFDRSHFFDQSLEAKKEPTAQIRIFGELAEKNKKSRNKKGKKKTGLTAEQREKKEAKKFEKREIYRNYPATPRLPYVRRFESVRGLFFRTV